MLKIYDFKGFPNPARVRIALAEKEMTRLVEFVSVDVPGGAHKRPEFLAKNPSGAVPVLELEDGTTIAECTAITEYLDNLDGNPVLTGRTPREKATIHMMQRRVEMMLLDPIDDYFHYATKGLGPALKPWRMPDWPAARDWGERRGAQALANLPYFEDVLTRQPFIAGNPFSMADITLFASLAFARGAGLPIDDSLTALADWHGRVSDLPAVRNRTGQRFRSEDIERRR
jgi:glutathione S-transferase